MVPSCQITTLIMSLWVRPVGGVPTIGVDDADCGHESEHRRVQRSGTRAPSSAARARDSGRASGPRPPGRMRVGIGTIRPHERPRWAASGSGPRPVTERGPGIRKRSLIFAVIG